jgi:hypothetical protein
LRDEISKTIATFQKSFTIKSKSYDHSTENSIPKKNLSQIFQGHNEIIALDPKYQGDKRFSRA